jgi:hypothetical protein
MQPLDSDASLINSRCLLWKDTVSKMPEFIILSGKELKTPVDEKGRQMVRIFCFSNVHSLKSSLKVVCEVLGCCHSIDTTFGKDKGNSLLNQYVLMCILIGSSQKKD